MTLVIGVGNADRGDDAAGLAVAERIRTAAVPGVTVLRMDGDQLNLLYAWADATRVYVVDAVRSGARPGTVFRFDAGSKLPVHFTGRGTHTFSLADVVELARALGTLPPRLAGFGIEGETFETGAGMSAVVGTAVGRVAGTLLGELTSGCE